MWTANLPIVLLWLAFGLTVAAAIPRLGVPLWIAVLLLILALLVRQYGGGASASLTGRP